MPEPLRRHLPLLLLLLLTGYYLFRETGAHAPLLDGISPGAQWISLHERPGPRLRELAATPLGETLLALTGGEPDPAGLAWMSQLFPREVLIAHEPLLGQSFSPGWVLISRVADRQARLRLLLDLGFLSRYHRTGEHHGNLIWTRFKEGRPPMSVAMANGKLIFCLHEDPQAIRHVLDRLDGRRPRFATFRELPEELLAGAQSPDRGYWLGSGELPAPAVLWIDSARPDRLRLQLRGPALNELGRFPDADPAALALLGGPACILMARLPALPFPGAEVPADLLLLGPPFHSTLALVPVPGLVLRQPAAPRETAFRLADQWMIRLQRLSGLSWTPVDLREGRQYLPADRTLRRLMPSAQAPVARHADGTLLLASNGELLSRLLDRANRPAAAFELRDVRWNDPEIFLWADGQGLASALNPAQILLPMLGDGRFDRASVTSALDALRQVRLEGRHLSPDPLPALELTLRLQGSGNPDGF